MMSYEKLETAHEKTEQSNKVSLSLQTQNLL